MQIAKISIDALSPAQLAALPRTTRWRAEKRGWVALNYHTRFTNIRVLASPQFEDYASAIYRQAGRIVGFCIGAGWGFPAHIDRDDLIQECAIELWRCSAKRDFPSAKWRGAVIFNHLRRLRQMCRFDRDNNNREEL
jgi:hypothetical protein